MPRTLYTLRDTISNTTLLENAPLLTIYRAAKALGMAKSYSVINSQVKLRPFAPIEFGADYSVKPSIWRYVIELSTINLSNQ